ncbi:MAG: TDP-N-acetylfucosamine:lipid II N-acetylfucosaminyltransferase, partial [Candidatus Pacebacteria bacterium]|nr:TDP-N-acetylfucosamine:lipid II N-acetylfucosaminyltransferase [Candidatus Paceibacterota bacterium]
MKGCMGKNNKVKYLHIFPDVLFFEPYVDFINKNFNSEDHLFLILTNREKINLRENAKKISKNFKDLSILIRTLYKSEKVILHGLINYQLILILFFQPWLLRKCYWVIFGGDLYFYKFRKKNLKSDIYEITRRFVIKNMNGIISLIKEEYELAQKWYGAKGKYYYSFLYPNGIYKEANLLKVKKSDKKIYIQIGHSADPALNHLKVF